MQCHSLFLSIIQASKTYFYSCHIIITKVPIIRSVITENFFIGMNISYRDYNHPFFTSNNRRIKNSISLADRPPIIDHSHLFLKKYEQKKKCLLHFQLLEHLLLLYH